MPTAPKYLTIGQAARRLGVSIDTLRRWEANGIITAVRTPGGWRRFPSDEVERLIHPNAA